MSLGRLEKVGMKGILLPVGNQYLFICMRTNHIQYPLKNLELWKGANSVGRRRDNFF